MKYTYEELIGKSVHTLRVVLREVGGVPGTADKKQLIDGILAIQGGEKPPARSPRGRKPIENLISLSSNAEPDLNVLEFNDIPLGEKYNLSGVVEICNGKYGFLRGLNCAFSKKDSYILPATISNFNLKHGDEIEVVCEKTRETSVLTVSQVLSVNGFLASKPFSREEFDCLSPRYPTQKIELADGAQDVLKQIDLFCPIGKGQRVIITADGDRFDGVIKKIATSISKNNSDITLSVLLSGVKPEEVTEYNDIENCRTTALTGTGEDEYEERKLDLFFSRLKRKAECGENVVAIINSLDSLVRYFAEKDNIDNLSGIKKVKNLFSKSGNYGKGSITVIGVVSDKNGELYTELLEIATCEIALIGCNERGDNKRVDIKKSYTVRDEYLLSEEEIKLADEIRNRG